MLVITNKRNDTVGYLYNNIILNENAQRVIGVMLGNCVFGMNSSKPVGKFFDDIFRNNKGEITGEARITNFTLDKTYEKTVLQQAWNILKNVKTHSCSWIEARSLWANGSFQDYLNEDNLHELPMLNFIKEIDINLLSQQNIAGMQRG
jgi:hypothetical protein